MQFKLEGSRPIWQQLAEQLTVRIVTGIYPAGSHFPTVRELASEAGVNPNTMQRAMAQLETDGLVTTNRTAGRTVTDREEVLSDMRRHLALERTDEYLNDLRALGFDRAEALEMIRREGEKNGD
jgi:DNA-binding transcriptional regulator YhcF (GntR family)